MNDIVVTIWRRGRGFQRWYFRYVTHSSESFFTTPGWYKASGRGRMYRLTIDHDYPQKPLWLGFKKGSRWVNAEGLYEVVSVKHEDFFLANSHFSGKGRRSKERLVKTKDVLLAQNYMIANREVKYGLKKGV